MARGTAIAACLLAWLVGTAAQTAQPALWPVAAYAAIGGAAAIVCGLIAWRFSQAWVLAAGVLLLAFALTGGRAAIRLGDSLADDMVGQDLTVVGVVDSLPRIDPLGTRFQFQVEAARRGTQAVTVPEHLQLAWYRDRDDDGHAGNGASSIRAGERWRFTVRLRPPYGVMNPHGFDQELYLFEQGIRATGSVRAQPAPQRLTDARPWSFDRLRQALRDRLAKALPDDPRAAGVIAALAIGDQSAIDKADWDIFRATGVAHLMSISGLHVTMFAWGAGVLVGWAWRRSERAMLRVPAPIAALWGGLAAALGYALLSGFGVPAQRTVWMLATLALLRTLGLQWPGPTMLLAAAAVVCAADPWALWQPGFWLSFVAVGWLMLASERSARADAGRVARLRATAAAAWRTQVVCTVGLAPLSMLFFQQVSIAGFLANLVAVPVVTLLVTPLSLLATLAPPLSVMAAAALAPLSALLEQLADMPAAVWTAAAPEPWAVIAALAGCGLLLMPLPWAWRAIGLLLLPPVLWPVVPRPEEGRFELVAADIGQGSAVLIRTRSHLLLADAGPSWGPQAEAGSRVLLPLLRAHGEPRIDTLVLTHGDADHIGGAGALLRGLPVADVLTSIPSTHPLAQTAASAGSSWTRCHAGQAWTWDGVSFRVLHPLADDSIPTSNATSCVLQVRDRDGVTALITGDIEAPQEAALVQREGDALRSQILIVPHHGSRTSSSTAFLAHVAPEVAVVQAGYQNRFGHPAADVVQRIRDSGAQVVRTDHCGAFTLSANGSTCTRLVRIRYWRWLPPVLPRHPDRRGAEVANFVMPAGDKDIESELRRDAHRR
jgi:competence protein ComEC